MNTSRSVQGAICFLFLLALVVPNHGLNINVKQHGARGDGRTNDGPAILRAWKVACTSPQASTLVIPAGTYRILPPMKIEGPCKAPVKILAEGAIFKAPPELEYFKDDSWFFFNHIDRLTLQGGTFDGQGHIAWARNNGAKTGKIYLPVNLRLHFLTNSLIHGVTSLNSKMFHFNVLGCEKLTMSRITIDAPEKSLNTDGIHIGRSNGVNITDPHIKTGDDCISLGDGCKNIRIERVTCGPGHGISIGSLGKYPKEDPVEGVWVKGGTITGTMNGVRIKTWPASPPGIARDIHFEDIIMNNVGNPVLIDQGYCPYNQCKKGSPSRVKISNVSFKGIRGTSSTKVATKIACSQGIGCDNVVMSNIDLKYRGPERGGAVSECANVRPSISGIMFPSACAKGVLLNL